MKKIRVTRYDLRPHYRKLNKKNPDAKPGLKPGEKPGVKTGGNPAASPLRIAVVSDLHDRCPDQILHALRREKPDLIVIPGDLGERNKLGAVMANGEISPWTVDKMNAAQGKKKLQSKMTKFIKLLDGSLSKEKAYERELIHREKQGLRLGPGNGEQMEQKLGSGCGEPKEQRLGSGNGEQKEQKLGPGCGEQKEQKLCPSNGEQKEQKLGPGCGEPKEQKYEKRTPKKKRRRLRKKSNRTWHIENGYHFLREASQIAPIYYSTGNHEWYLTAEDMQVMEECGVTLLDNCDCTIEVKGKTLKIGGLPTRAEEEWVDQFLLAELDSIFKILLMHHPEYYPRYLTGRDTCDLIISGHAHGGQWRIFGRGIFAPNQGFFPKYHHGVYKTENPCGAMVVSAGCSNTANIPRFGNPTELVIITI